jgi:hypothetical protein
VIARLQRRSTLLNSSAIRESSSTFPRTLFRIQAMIARSFPAWCLLFDVDRNSFGDRGATIAEFPWR